MIQLSKKQYIFLAGGVTLALGLTTLYFSDLSLHLRSQAAISIPGEPTHEFTWTPSLTAIPQDQTLTIEAVDSNGNLVTKDIVVTVLPSDELSITDVVAVAARDEVRFTWTTSKPVNSGVVYDVNNKLRRVQEKTELTTAHDVTVTGLSACTTYQYQVVAVLGDKEVETSITSFTTQGCVGDALVLAKNTADLTNGGGTVTLNDKLTITLPDGSTTGEQIQVHQLQRDIVLSAVGAPDSLLSPVTGTYELSVLTAAGQKESTFSQPVRVALAYTPAADTDMNTLALYGFDSSWRKLDNCAVESSVLTCETNQFSVVAGFATGGGSTDDPPPAPTSTPTPTAASSSGDSGGSSGDGGGGGDGSSESSGGGTSSGKVYTFQAETGHKISGAWSGVVKLGKLTAVKLAQNNAVLEKKIATVPANYYLEVQVRNDRPGSDAVKIAVYLNNRAWKVISLDKKKINNGFSTYRVGTLRNFKGATVRFRFLNDVFDKARPTDEDSDRNAFIDWWRLVPAP